MSLVHCEGWWEQAEFGRQPMDPLTVEFDTGRISGSGNDIVGLFTLTGTIEGGNVAIVKQYIGQHSVDYVGTFDGEGTMHGRWGIAGWFGGNWMIKIAAHAVEPAEAEIPEWRPVEDSTDG